MKLSWALLAMLCLIGCSSSPSTDKQTKTAAPAVANHGSNPVAKYIELVGFRVREKGAGHLAIQFGVVNHSEADAGDLQLNVSLVTTTAKAGDPPIFTFTTKVPALGPLDMKEVTVDVPSKMRVYELPDWQFVKADFQVTTP